MVKLRYADETYLIRRLLFRVRNELKLGWSEEIYHQALLHVLEAEAIPVVSKPRCWLMHRGQQVHLFEPDLILWDKIILELKALAFTKHFVGEHYAQLIHYLKYFSKNLGLLVNFCSTPIAIQRVLWDEHPFMLQEDFTSVQKHINLTNRAVLIQIRKVIIEIAHQFGFGYPDTVYRRLLSIEFAYNDLHVIEDAVVPIELAGKSTIDMNTQHLLIEDKFLLHIRSLLDQPSGYDYARTKNYLAHLGLSIGLVINFSRKKLQIHAVSLD